MEKSQRSRGEGLKGLRGWDGQPTVGLECDGKGRGGYNWTKDQHNTFLIVNQVPDGASHGRNGWLFYEYARDQCVHGNGSTPKTSLISNSKQLLMLKNRKILSN